MGYSKLQVSLNGYDFHAFGTDLSIKVVPHETVTSVSPRLASIRGGTELRVTGSGIVFNSIMNENSSRDKLDLVCLFRSGTFTANTRATALLAGESADEVVQCRAPAAPHPMRLLVDVGVQDESALLWASTQHVNQSS